MTIKNIKIQLVTILKNHYAFDEYEFNEVFMGKLVKEIDLDSIALLELFLVVEEGFELNNIKLSSRISMEEAMDSPVEKLIDMIALEILKIFRESSLS